MGAHYYSEITDHSTTTILPTASLKLYYVLFRTKEILNDFKKRSNEKFHDLSVIDFNTQMKRY